MKQFSVHARFCVINDVYLEKNANMKCRSESLDQLIMSDSKNNSSRDFTHPLTTKSFRGIIP